MSANANAETTLLKAARILDGLGLTEGFGHVSTRVSPQDILITGAIAPGLAGAEDLFRFRPTGEQVESALSGIRAALETPMHLEVYRVRPDVGAICRTHSPYAVVCGSGRRPVFATHGFGAMLGPVVHVYDDSDLITDCERAAAVADQLAAEHALLLRGNGALVTGRTLEEATVRAIYLEESARNAVLGGMVGGCRPFSTEELALRARWFENEISRAWRFYAAKYAS